MISYHKLPYGLPFSLNTYPANFLGGALKGTTSASHPHYWSKTSSPEHGDISDTIALALRHMKNRCSTGLTQLIGFGSDQLRRMALEI